MTVLCRCDTEVYARGMCRPCYERDLRHRNPEYAERQRCQARAWRSLNIEAARARDRERVEDPARKRERRLLSLYGLTSADYDDLMSQPCGICGADSVHLDHDHETGQVRGGLCHRCNLGVGYLEGWFMDYWTLALAWIGEPV